MKAYGSEQSENSWLCFAKLEDEGVRIRDSVYQAVRTQYKDEIRQISSFRKDSILIVNFIKDSQAKRKEKEQFFINVHYVRKNG